MKNKFQNIELLVNMGTGSRSLNKSAFLKTLSDEGIQFETKDFCAHEKKIKQKKEIKSSRTKENLDQFENDQRFMFKSNVQDHEINPWDLAHKLKHSMKSVTCFVEPDTVSEFVIQRKINDNEEPSHRSIGKQNDGNFDADWLPHANTIWHLDDAHSQLMSARKEAEQLNSDKLVRIGHLDTGYDPVHPQLPPRLNTKLQRNFILGETPTSAVDPLNKAVLYMPGHGTGTLGILAGGKFVGNGFNDKIGGAPFAEIIPCRISNTVVLIKTSEFAQALNYLSALHKSGEMVHIVSMSMGGAPSQAWADAVNEAYESGILMVSAAGNNYNGLPIRKLVYPARFERVIAACGATFEDAPYYHKKIGEMQGNYGPSKSMNYALAAYTPNTPWAVSVNKSLSFSGAGTSSATPQIAAAAACYLKKYYEEITALPEPWMRVEAVRNALYTSAAKKVNSVPEENDYRSYFGNGILRASDALKITVPKKGKNLIKAKDADVGWFPILSTIFRSVESVTAAPDAQGLNMLNIELAQISYSNAEMNKLMNNDEIDFYNLSKKKKKQLMELLICIPESSMTLKSFLKNNYKSIISI
ncbi:MAG: S8/S53 family peptidase [Saprospiraceae bacterium]|nr:S8/S53 family peptidase [Candidatus Vicinibacter affinis]